MFVNSLRPKEAWNKARTNRNVNSYCRWPYRSVIRRTVGLLLVLPMILSLEACVMMDPEPEPEPTKTGPTASFSADETSGPAPSLIEFSDTSTPGTSAISQWSWNFGDGLESTRQNPVHDYGEPGKYTVSLSVTTADGSDTETRTEYIEIVAVAPAMPTVIGPVGVITGSTAMLSGESAPEADILVTGGSNNVSTTADSDGAFAVEVPVGANRITRLFVTATRNGLSSPPVPVDVTNDSQAPTVFIDFPEDGSQLTESSVTVAGRIGDMLSGFEALTVSLGGISGEIAVGIGNSGTFEIRDIPLVPGDNVLQVVAMDAAGNTKNDTISVTRVDPAGDRLTIVSGNSQTGMVKTALPDPVQVLLSDENGTPISGRTLLFDVVRSDGRLDDGTDVAEPSNHLEVATDENGMASLFWTLGTDAGCGNNRLRVREETSGSTVTLCASAVASAPVQLNLVGGNNQRGATNGMTAEPLRVRVSDGDNGIPGVMVDFMAMTGGQVDDQIVATVETDTRGIAEVKWVLGEEAGSNLVVAEFEGNLSAPVFFEAIAVASTEGLATSLSGIVMDNNSQPVGGAPCELEVNGEAVPDVITGADGRFVFENVPAGQGHLHVGGLVATQLGGESIALGSLPDLAVAVTVVPNANNTLPSPVLLPQLDPENARSYDGSSDVELTVNGIEGLRMIVRAGSMRRPDGSEPTPDDPAILALNQVQTDDIPMPLPNGVATPFAWTLQPSGATFDPPVEIVYPNMAGLPAGTASFFLSFNHDTGAFEVVGTGAVTADGAEIVTDRGSGISVAGWGGNCPPYSATGEVKSCEANMSALLKEATRFLIAVGKDLNKFTKVLNCFSDIAFNGPDCISAYRTFRDSGSNDVDKAREAIKCAKALKVIANNCADVFISIDPFKLAGRAKLLSDGIARALAFARANDCFVGTSGAQVLKGLEAINNLVNPFLDLANDASPRKLAITLACFFMQTIVDGFEFDQVSRSKGAKGEPLYSEEMLAELDAMFEELPAILDDLVEGNDEVLARLNDPALLADISEAMTEFQGALDAELTATELAGFTVQVSDQITVADEFGLVDFGNITIPDDFGAGGPGTAPDSVGDDILHLLGFKETENGTRYVYSGPFQITANEAFVIDGMALTFSDDVPPFPESVALSADFLAIPVSDTSQLTLTGTFFNGDTADVTAAADGTTYRASNTAIITVSGDGLITAVAEGTAYVTATNNATTSVRRVTVSNSLIATTVQGRVLDFNGDPVAGAVVSTALGGQAVTDANGFFTLALTLPGGTAALTLSINVDGDIFSTGILAVVPGGTVEAGTLTYVPTGATTTVVGKVERANGDPLSGAVVRTDQGGEGTADSLGAFSFTVTLTNFDPITAFATFSSDTEELSGMSTPVAPVIEGMTNVGTIVVAPAVQVLYPRQRISVDPTPGDLAVADFNDDGIPDIMTVNEIPDTLSLALGQGDGSFSIPTNILIGTDSNFGIGINPDALAVADFDEDGDMDVVTANLFTSDISFVPGNGDGTFGESTRYGSGVSPNSIVAADFDGDGHLDVATPNTGTNDISVLLGNGDGTFQAHVAFAADDIPRFLRVADFNNDDIPDIAAANDGRFGGTVSILLGIGDGTFADQTIVDLGSDTDSLATGDFNDDGTMDFAANRTGLSGDIVSIHLGNGDGTFTTGDDISVPGTQFLEAVDLDGDGDLDLLVSFIGQQFGLLILDGAGDGSFAESTRLTGGQFPDRVVPADLNNDGSLDLALVNTQSDDVSVYLADSPGVFADLRFTAGPRPIVVELAHMDLDGELDAVVINDDTSSTPEYSVTVLPGNGDGAFQAGTKVPIINTPFDGVAGDLNNDGHGDLIVSRCCDGAIDVLLSDGAGGFPETVTITLSNTLAVLALGDVDGDGNLDLAASVVDSQDDTLAIYLGNGDGTFQEPLTFSGTPSPNAMALVDMNNDGNLDAVIASFTGFFVLAGTGDGAFAPPSMAAVNSGVTGLAVGDLNGDGAPDVGAVVFSPSAMVVALGNGDGTLMTPLSTPIFSNPSAIAFAEVSADGVLDALVTNQLNNTVEVYTGVGDGTFNSADVYGAGQAPSDLETADVNGDGLPDVVMANERGGDIGVLLHE